VTVFRTLLAIETAGSGCSAAVARGEAMTVERRLLRHGHAEVLLPMIGRVMRKAGMAAADLDWVAAAVGPGGFTGIRVGLAAAHGIALAAGAHLIGISSFEAVAAAVPGGGDGDCALLVALDSRREDLYTQLFALSPPTALAPPRSVLPDRLADYARAAIGGRRLLVAGDAAACAAAALGQHCAVAIIGDSAPDAGGVAAAALRRLRFGEPAPAMRPLYLHPPDVSLPRRHGHAAGFS